MQVLNDVFSPQSKCTMEQTDELSKQSNFQFHSSTIHGLTKPLNQGKSSCGIPRDVWIMQIFFIIQTSSNIMRRCLPGFLFCMRELIKMKMLERTTVSGQNQFFCKGNAPTGSRKNANLALAFLAISGELALVSALAGRIKAISAAIVSHTKVSNLSSKKICSKSSACFGRFSIHHACVWHLSRVLKDGLPEPRRSKVGGKVRAVCWKGNRGTLFNF